ncbi:MAG: hypothetical protein FWF15_06260 [Oscillospiraceae bacterium]|nr:hypothetical protein [Oscillospiraceae bacterium]
MHFFYAIGGELEINAALAFVNNLYANEIINEREKKLITIALSCTENNFLRADIMRQIILAVMK